MFFFLYLILIFVMIIDVILYLSIKIHVYQDKESFYIFVYSLPLIKIDKNNRFNLLENKISIDKIYESNNIDLKIIDTIKINKILIRIDIENTYEYSYIFYPLFLVNNTNIINYKITNENKIYCVFSIKLVNIILKIIKIRREKSERTSNK